MKTSKKSLSIFCAVCMMLSLVVSAYAAEIQPRAMELDVDVAVSTPNYTSDKFSCVNGNGNTLRYWFDNTGSYSCKVTLYKVGLFGDKAVSSMDVPAGGAEFETLSDPGNVTFYIKVVSSGGVGSGVYGTLRANQLDT